MKMKTLDLIAALQNIAGLVRVHDSMRGTITYDATEERGVFEVHGNYGIGQSDGQGGTRIIEPTETQPESGETMLTLHDLQSLVENLHHESRVTFLTRYIMTKGVSPETVFTLGQLEGVLDKLRGLIRQDIRLAALPPSGEEAL